MKTLLTLVLLAGCEPAGAWYCDASAATVDGEPIGDLAIANGTTRTGCFYFAAAEALGASLYQGSLSKPDALFDVTLRRGVGQKVLSDGHGGVRLLTAGHDCIAYGLVELVSDLPDWRVDFLDVECEDGTRVEGSMHGRFH